MSTNIRIQDMDIVSPNLLDDRRVEVLADGLPLFHGQQLAIDTTLVSALGRDGLPRPRCAHVDGAILEAARRRKERHHLELSGQQGRTRLVVLAAEVGGRWSQESVRFLVQLAKAKVRHEPKVMRVSVSALGSGGGGVCWLAQPPKLSPCHCWNVELVLVLMGPHQPHQMWSVTVVISGLK